MAIEDRQENGDVAHPQEKEKESLVKQVICYVEKPLWLHGYITVFLPIYGFWAYAFRMTELLSFEVAMILLAGIGILQTLVVLSCVWSVAIRCALTCTKVCYRLNISTRQKRKALFWQVDDPKMATVVQVIPYPNNGSAELVRLNRSHTEVKRSR